VRKPTGLSHPKLTEIPVDFDQLESAKDSFKGVDSIFCTLGTTMAKAGSKETFYKVDYTYVVKMAEIGKETGASQFLVVTALGTDKNSPIFYNKVKGEAEEAIIKSGIGGIKIFRPSLLLGDRKENRPGEKIGEIVGNLVSPLLFGFLKKYKPIQAEKVALAMWKASKERDLKKTFESDEIESLAGGVLR
jgi:uncharacterized protein YbjT (DUF2867 family)